MMEKRVVAGLAALSGAFATYLIVGTSNMWVFTAVPFVLAVLAAVPLLCSADRRAFDVASVVCAVLLVVLGCLGFFFGGLLFLPSAGLLVLARFSLPRRVWAPLIVILAVAVVAPWSNTMWNDMYRVPDLFVVYLPPNGPEPPHDTLLYDGSGIGYGATSVSISPEDTGDKVYVYFHHADETRLEAHLHELMPYATKIERCRHHSC
jgi:hypothetical protein